MNPNCDLWHVKMYIIWFLAVDIKKIADPWTVQGTKNDRYVWTYNIFNMQLPHDTIVNFDHQQLYFLGNHLINTSSRHVIQRNFLASVKLYYVLIGTRIFSR